MRLKWGLSVKFEVKVRSAYKKLRSGYIVTPNRDPDQLFREPDQLFREPDQLFREPKELFREPSWT